jgi:two-component system response regulator CpxR
MLTAWRDGSDRGLEIADDYLQALQPREANCPDSPFNAGQPEWSGSRNGKAVERWSSGCNWIRRARSNNYPVDLTSVEFALLEVLLRASGQVVTRENLAKEVLGRRLSPYDRSIDVHISSLRRKLGHLFGDTERIKTVRGTGYVYTRPPESSGREGQHG